MDKQIREGKNVFIFGAGASMEFLPLFRGKPLSTDTLTNLFTVFDGEFYASLTKELDKTLVVKELLYEIVIGLRKYYGFRGKNPVNFEQIMHLVDLYCSICAEKFRLVAYSRSPAELIDLNLPFIVGNYSHPPSIPLTY